MKRSSGAPESDDTESAPLMLIFVAVVVETVGVS